MSLTEFMEGNDVKLKQKIQILIKISRTMMLLMKKSELNSHGHLCPNNILINPRTLNLKICDFGFTFLRKYCALLNGYRNKDVFCAPEILKSKKNVVSGHNEASDVYSFAMLAWYILVEEMPFQSYSLSKIRHVICHD